MIVWEYRIVPAPRRGIKVRGARTTEERFAAALEEVMNREGAEGWEYLRSDTLPVEERQGLTGKTTVYQNLLVFRRAVAGAGTGPLTPGPAAQPLAPAPDTPSVPVVPAPVVPVPVAPAPVAPVPVAPVPVVPSPGLAVPVSSTAPSNAPPLGPADPRPTGG